MNFSLNPETEALLDQLRELIQPSENLFMVGGMVRDILLNLEVHDIDLSLIGDVRKFGKKAADKLNGAFYMLNDKYNAARIILSGNSKPQRWIDIVGTYQSDIYRDLEHRDFTINSMAIDFQNRGKLIDPLNGSSDLRLKVLRLSNSNGIKDDPIRIMRAIRLAVKFDLKMDPETIQVIKHDSGLLKGVVSERLRDELFRFIELSKLDTALQLANHFNLRFFDCGWNLAFGENRLKEFSLESIQRIQLLQIFDTLILRESKPDGALNLLQAELAINFREYRKALQTYFSTCIVPNRSFWQMMIFSVLIEDCQKNYLYPDEPAHSKKKESKIEKILNRFALSNQEKKWVRNFLSGMSELINLFNEYQAPEPGMVYKFFSHFNQSGIAVIIWKTIDHLLSAGNELNIPEWRRWTDFCLYFLDGYFKKHDEWITPPDFLNGYDVMNMLNITDGKTIGYWLEQIKIRSVRGEINNREEGIAFLQENIHLSNFGKNQG